MGTTALRQTSKSRDFFLVLFFCLIGILARLILIGQVPYGLNQDEASAGYEAWSILNYGIDRHGISYPVHLIAWGSGQNIAYSWFCMPFIALFGLSEFTVRLPMALIGCVSVVLFYFFLDNVTPLPNHRKYVLFGTLLFAICPWHIMKSRWGLESNLFPDLILWGSFCLSIFCRKHSGGTGYLYAAFVIFGFSAYSYGTSYCFLPFFVLPLLFYLLRTKRITLRQGILALVLLTLVALPIILFVLINTFQLSPLQLGPFTIPRLYQNRHTEVTSVFYGNILLNSLKNFFLALGVMFFQHDSLPWNATHLFGILYPVTLLLTLWGIFCCFSKFRSRCKEQPEYIVNFWFLSGVALMFIVDPNINRLNILMIPWIYYTAVGTAEFTGRFRRGLPIAALLFTAAFFTFVGFYFTHYAQKLKPYFFDGLGTAITQTAESDASRIYISSKVNMPYIFVLFYMQIDPFTYQETAEISNPHAAFEKVSSMDRYIFSIPESPNPAEDAVYILSCDELAGFDSANFHLTPCGTFYIAEPLA